MTELWGITDKMLKIARLRGIRVQDIYLPIKTGCSRNCPVLDVAEEDDDILTKKNSWQRGYIEVDFDGNIVYAEHRGNIHILVRLWNIFEESL